MKILILLKRFRMCIYLIIVLTHGLPYFDYNLHLDVLTYICFPYITIIQFLTLHGQIFNKSLNRLHFIQEKVQ